MLTRNCPRLLAEDTVASQSSAGTFPKVDMVLPGKEILLVREASKADDLDSESPGIKSNMVRLSPPHRTYFTTTTISLSNFEHRL